MSAVAIAIEGLRKDYALPERGRFLRAVESLTLSVDSGQVYGLLGPNGSGKSTTIKIALDLVRASLGEVRIFGASSRDPSVRRRIGYLPEAPYYYRQQTAWETMLFFGKLAGLGRREGAARAEGLLERFGIADAAHRRLGGFSKGMLQRFGFAQAMVGDPDLLILDEPTAGVDPVGSAEIGRFIMELKGEGKTVLLCSHLLSQVQSVCDRVAILNRGRLLAEGPLEELLRDDSARTLSIEGLDAERAGELRRAAESAGGRVSESVARKNLEELFLDLVAASRSEATGASARGRSEGES